MNSETIVMCVVALILGMLLAHILKDVCGCKNVIEGVTESEQSGECFAKPQPNGLMAPNHVARCNSFTTQEACEEEHNSHPNVNDGFKCTWQPHDSAAADAGYPTCTFQGNKLPLNYYLGVNNRWSGYLGREDTGGYDLDACKNMRVSTCNQHYYSLNSSKVLGVPDGLVGLRRCQPDKSRNICTSDAGWGCDDDKKWTCCRQVPNWSLYHSDYSGIPGAALERYCEGVDCNEYEAE